MRLRIAVVLSAASMAVAGPPEFELHEMGDAGRKLGQTSLVDVDRDGDLDFISGQRAADIFWWEYRGPDEWVRHTLGEKAPTDVGGVAFDVDGDGWVDQCSGGAWYKNPGDPRSKRFQKFDNGAIVSHDNRAADIDGDRKLDLVALHEKQGAWWYRIPTDPTQKWIATRIGDGRHSGLAIADIDGDADQDVVVSDWWYENGDGKGGAWRKHESIPFDGRPYNAFGMALQVRAADFDGDGDMDLAAADGETKDAAAAWIENVDGEGGAWKRHELITGRGALHSMQVADFDNNGHADIFTCEMEIGGEGAWFLFLNDGRGQFTQHVILTGVAGHETRAGDVDADGDIDLCSKPWNTGRHVYLENKLR